MDFNHIKVSTQTYIVQSNISNVDLVKLTECFEPTETLINLKYKTITKGTFKVKKRKIKKPPGKMFLNCATISMLVNDKTVNVKIFNNGVFQITGCKLYDHAIACIKNMIELFHEYQCILCEHDKIRVYLTSVMRNIDFGLDFKINREAMATTIHDTTDYCVPPLTKGYMGIKIKIPLKNVDDLPVMCMSFDSTTMESRIDEPITFKTLMTDIVKNIKKLKKERFISVSVFQNGKVLMSGPDVCYQKTYYDWFIKFITENKDKINHTVLTTPKKTFKLQ